MEVSIPCNCSEIVVLDHNVVDETRAYDKGNGVDSVAQPYVTDDVLKDQDKLYQFIGESFTPETWTSANEIADEYLPGDILYKDHYNVIVGEIGLHDEAQQPENYSYDTSWLYDLWTHRYTRLQTGITLPFNGVFDYVVGDSIHNLYKSTSSSTGWYHRVSYPTTTSSWTSGIYQLSVPESYVRVTDGTTQVVIYYKGNLVYNSPYNAKLPVPLGSVFIGSDGKSYKNAYYIRYDGTNTYYAVSQLVITNTTGNKYQEAVVAYEADMNVFENTAYSFGDPIRERWVGRHFIVRGSSLYMRTWVDLPQIIVPVSDNQYTILETLSVFPEFVEIGVVNYQKPFDQKKYTSFTQETSDLDPTVYYTLQISKGSFDTVAMAGLIANDVEVIFKLPDGTEAAHIQSYEPRNYRDQTLDSAGEIVNRLDPYPTTAILYSIADEPMPENSTVEIIFKGVEITLGTMMFGLSVNAGFTNLQFSTKFNDWSPKEVDQWGNVTYITADSGGNTVDVKTLTWNGTVDIPITSFDMTTRLMTSMGASTLIINGSDAKDNQPPNNVDVFASTMLIGRLKNFDLKTKLKNKKMNEYATYSIVVEEDI